MANFFEQQQAARRKTHVMVMLYGLAVLGVVAAVDAVIATIWLFNSREPAFPVAGASSGLASMPASVFVVATLATLAVILVASLIEVLRLRGGGEAIAEMMGARRVAPDTRDALERRLLNVVEEMAIASGVRVPQAFIMDGESAINAFAAGHDVSRAVIAVTRGTLETLTRDELQGVIGHEFSHILNGDMALNIRMLGVLAGIVFVSSIGGFIMRNLSDSRNSGLAFFVLGLALFIIGYVGLFFARLIKASVSREREYLADASSVQFTRNPDGIAGALDQIRSSGSLIANRYAEDMSHMFFGQGIGVWLGGLFDTHPSIDERIRRVNPRFLVDAYRRRRLATDRPDATPAPAAKSAADGATSWQRSPVESMALVGQLRADKVDQARSLLARLPAEVREQLRDPDGAGAIVVALMLAPEEAQSAVQLAAADAAGQTAIGQRARALAPALHGLGPAFQLPVVDLALPALKLAPAASQDKLIRALEAVIHADGRVTLHEFAVLSLIRSQCRPPAKKPPKPVAIAERRHQVIQVLSLMAQAGCPGDAPAAAAFQAAFGAAAREVGLADAAADTGASPEQAAAALEDLRALGPLQKALLVKAMFAAVMADGVVRIAEAELLRTVAAVLDCPLGPLLDNLAPLTLAA